MMKAPPSVSALRIPEFLDEHRAIGEGRVDVRFPAGCVFVAFVVVDVGRVDDARNPQPYPPAGSVIATSHVVIGILLAADDANVWWRPRCRIVCTICCRPGVVNPSEVVPPLFQTVQEVG